MSVDASAAMRFHGTAQYRGTNCPSPVAIVLDRTLSICGSAKLSNVTNGACLVTSTDHSMQTVECVDNDADGAMETVPHLQLLTSGTRGCNFFSNQQATEHNLLTLVRLGVCVNVFESARMDSTLPSQKSVAAVIVRLNSSIAAPDSSNQKQSLFVSQFSEQNCASSSLVNTYPLGVSNGECTFFDQSGVSSSALLANNYGATALTLHSSVSSCSSKGSNPVSFHYSFAQSKCTPTPANTCIPAAPMDDTSSPTSHYSEFSMHASIACIPQFQQTAHLDFLKSQRPAWAVPSQNRDYLYMHTFLDNACTALRGAHIVKLDACVPNHVHVARTGANQTVFPAWVTRDASASDEDDFKGEAWMQMQQESSKTAVAYRLHLDAADSTVYKTEFTDTQCMDPVSIPLKQVVVGRVNVGCVGRVLLQWNSADAFSSSAPTRGTDVSGADVSNQGQEFSVKTGIIVGTTVFFGVIVLGAFIAFAYFYRQDNLARRAKVWERELTGATTRHASRDATKSFWRRWWNSIGKRRKYHEGMVGNGTEGNAMHLGDGVL
ncbi:hypothetical protein BJ741DRAFT_621063 [Chytriomyces cf. hyalinus JEL632]|nr:hypothetical protein BJ741DRAFT_621063 [Chytriomyces cf. hyalinus JEL632]